MFLKKNQLNVIRYCLWSIPSSCETSALHFITLNFTLLPKSFALEYAWPRNMILEVSLQSHTDTINIFISQCHSPHLIMWQFLVFLCGYSGWGVKLTTHIHLVPRSRNELSYTSTPPIRLHGVMLSFLITYAISFSCIYLMSSRWRRKAVDVYGTMCQSFTNILQQFLTTWR
jgi:hypothetical protein